MAAVAPWGEWLSYPGDAKQEWELDESGANLSDVCTLSVSLFTGEAFPNLRRYAIAPSKFLIIGLDIGYEANEFVWRENNSRPRHGRGRSSTQPFPRGKEDYARFLWKRGTLRPLVAAIAMLAHDSHFLWVERTGLTQRCVGIGHSLRARYQRT